MKKLLAVLTAIVLLCCGLLSACTPKPAPADPTVAPATVTDAPATATAEPTKEPVELKNVKVAYHTNWGGAAIVVIGQQLGIWEKYGFDLDLYGFTSGPVEIASMVSGELDYGFVGHGAHTLAIQGKVDVITYEKMGDDEALIVNADSGLSTIADLKGQTIGTTRGTSAETVLLLALKQAGLTEDDVAIADMDVSALTVAMTTGKVDAVCTYGSARATICNKLGSKALVLARTSSFDTLTSPSSWIATPKYITRNYDEVVRFVAAIIECLEYLKPEENRDQVYQWVADFLEQDYETVKGAASDLLIFTAEEMLAELDGKIAELYKNQQASFLASEKISAAVDVSEYVQFDIMKAACELVIANRG